MEILILIPLLLLGYFFVKYFSFIRTVHRTIKTQRDFSRRYREQQERQQQESRRSAEPRDPEQTSVDRINDASIDLEGGEYVEYEDVK